MEQTSYRVKYKNRVGHTVTHVVHCLDDAIKIKNSAKKDNYTDIEFVKLIRNFDYSITEIPQTI